MDTRGICCSFEEEYLKDKRIFLFEIDGIISDNIPQFTRVMTSIMSRNLDVLIHKTMRGYHFISPTVIRKTTWRAMMEELRDINPMCPMVTMRWIPNKYPNEESIWYINKAYISDDRENFNSKEVANLLNKTFGSEFEGDIEAQPKMVTYQLPEMEIK